MRNDDIRSNKALLNVASKNLNRVDDALAQVAWPSQTVGIAEAIRSVQLAVQQTINVVVKVLDDL